MTPCRTFNRVIRHIVFLSKSCIALLRCALFMQDSLLMSQMRRRPDRFMYPASGATRGGSADDAPISDRLAQLGDKARQRLAALGARFQRRRQQTSDRNNDSGDAHPRYETRLLSGCQCCIASSMMGSFRCRFPTVTIFIFCVRNEGNRNKVGSLF